MALTLQQMMGSLGIKYTSNYGPQQQPVAIGPRPTQTPPKTAVYTPQYSGSQTFSNSNPVTYTSTPAGQAAMAAMPTGQNTSSTFSDGGGGGGDGGGGADGGESYTPPVIPTRTYNIGGQEVTAPDTKEGAISAFSGLYPSTDYSNFADQYSPEEFYKLIDENYQGVSDIYGQNQTALEAAQSQYQKQIESDYSANQAKADASKASTEGKLAESGAEAQQAKQSALATATKLYNDLLSGYRQRFGGATSAGEAAQTILGQEQQRQSGSIGQSYGNAVRQIATQRVDLENSYNTAIKELDSQKQTALAQVQQNFLTNLTSINNARAASLEAKNAAKMQALQNARNQTLQIAQQREQFAQQLEAARYQQQLNLELAEKQMQMNAGTYKTNAANAVNTIPKTISTNITPSNTKATSSVLPQTSALNSAVGYMYNPQSQNLSFEERMRLGL